MINKPVHENGHGNWSQVGGTNFTVCNVDGSLYTTSREAPQTSTMALTNLTTLKAW